MNTFCIETLVSIDRHGKSCLQDSGKLISDLSSFKKSDKVDGEKSVQDKSCHMETCETSADPECLGLSEKAKR